MSVGTALFRVAGRAGGLDMGLEGVARGVDARAADFVPVAAERVVGFVIGCCFLVRVSLAGVTAGATGGASS